MSKKKKEWIQKANLKKGAFAGFCKSKGSNGVNSECIAKNKQSNNPKTKKQAVLAETFRNMAKNKKGKYTI